MVFIEADTRVPVVPAIGATTAGLPAQRVGSRPAMTARGSVAMTGATAPTAGHLFVIEPDAAAAEQLAVAATRLGMTVTVAGALTSPTALAREIAATPSPDPVLDVAAVSLRIGPSAAAVIAQLRAGGWLRIVALSVTAAPEDITAALKAGATGALTVGNPSAARAVPTAIYDLSAREVEVVRMVSEGRSNKWIGENLGLSSLTVKSHLARIGRKLGTGDRAHMAVIALRAGVIS